MSEYYSVAVPSMQKIYHIGTKSSAKYTLPLLIDLIVQKHDFVFYYDGGYCEDLYEDDLKFEQVDFDGIPKEHVEFAEQNMMDNKEFSLFYENFLSKETNWDSFKKLKRNMK
jgi:hypothetical protein